jgi:HD-GYP domain-containing protein (c-di-GMP phosphodiesterase class II)
MKTHTIEGQRMLDRVGGALGDVGRIVRASHEHWDGNGYPDGLAGASIPREATVVAACDAFNAMTTDRSYRRSRGVPAALEELRRHAGSQFAPDVVDAVVRVLGESPELAGDGRRVDRAGALTAPGQASMGAGGAPAPSTAPASPHS